jgi:hypothetical protein
MGGIFSRKETSVARNNTSVEMVAPSSISRVKVTDLRLTPDEEKKLRKDLQVELQKKFLVEIRDKFYNIDNPRYAETLRGKADKVAMTRPNSIPLTNDEIIDAEVDTEIEKVFNNEFEKRKSKIKNTYIKGGWRRKCRTHKRRTHKRRTNKR